MTRRILAVIRTAIIAPIFVSIWTWFLPRWFGGAHAFEQPRPLGFDGDYAGYCGAVRRWIPRLTPWYAPAHLE